MSKSSSNSGGGLLEVVALLSWVLLLFISPFTPHRARITIKALIIGGSVFLGGLFVYAIHSLSVSIYHLHPNNGAFVVALLAFPVCIGYFPYLVVREVWDGDALFDSIPHVNVVQYLICFAFYSSIISFLITQLPK